MSRPKPVAVSRKRGFGLVAELRGHASCGLALSVLLLLWGTLDQVRYYWALHADDLKDLRRAAVLDSFDSPLQLRLARQELKQGEMQAAESALQAGIRVNPADLAPRQALLQFLIGQKRFDEAFALTEASLQFAPKDVNLLVDRGLLAQGRGHPDQAVESWKRALAIDPGHASAHLYLADELDREEQPLESAAHYTKFLEIIARQTPATTVPRHSK